MYQNFSNVYVSPNISSWMTAFVLYIPGSIYFQPFALCVQSVNMDDKETKETFFAKENNGKGKIKRDESLIKFKYFIAYLRNLYYFLERQQSFSQNDESSIVFAQLKNIFGRFLKINFSIQFFNENNDNFEKYEINFETDIVSLLDDKVKESIQQYNDFKYVAETSSGEFSQSVLEVKEDKLPGTESMGVDDTDRLIKFIVFLEINRHTQNGSVIPCVCPSKLVKALIKRVTKKDKGIEPISNVDLRIQYMSKMIFATELKVLESSNYKDEKKVSECETICNLDKKSISNEAAKCVEEIKKRNETKKGGKKHKSRNPRHLKELVRQQNPRKPRQSRQKLRKIAATTTKKRNVIA